MKSRNLSIRTELVLALALVGALAATFVLLFFPARQALVTRALLDRTATNLAIVAGRSSTAALEFDDPESATSSLHDLSANPDVEFALVIKPTGEIFAQYVRRPLNLLPLVRLIGQSGRSVGTLAWRDYRVGVWRIVSGGEHLGTVAVGFSTAHVDSVIRTSRSISIAVGFGMLLCLSVFGIVLGKIVGGPIRATAMVMQEIASDDRTLQVKLEAGGGNNLVTEGSRLLWPAEIMVLRESFLNMLRRLAQSRRALEQLTASLEERVKERTLELEERDRTLEARNAELRSKASMLVSRNAALEQARQVLDRQRKELEGANTELEKASRLKSEFLANMSHEMRTPLNGIAGFIELALDNDNLLNEQREYLEIARRSTENLTSLINDILDFSKIEAGRLELERVDFSVRELIESIHELLSVRARDKGLALVYDVSPDVPDLLQGDPTRIRQILVNLVGNAIKFTEEGHVALRVQYQGEAEDGVWVRFSVSDTGIGIAPEKEAQIFESFRQADGSTTRKYGGTGLGLAISRKLVEQMGGELHVESVLGLGSTFWFKVPLQRGGVEAKGTVTETGKAGGERPAERQDKLEARLEQSPPVKEEKKALPGTASDLDTAKPRILVAEDNPVNRKLVLTILKKRGYLVDTAANGREAMEAVLARPYSLVLMDVQMPEMDGLEAIRRIRDAEGKSRRTPIVTMTAHAMKGDRERCLAAGADDYLSKPVRAQQLIECVERWTSEEVGKNGGDDMEEKTVQGQEPVDTERLNDSTAGDQELALELASIFLEATPVQLQALREAVEAGDAERVAEISHTMKGSCGSLGATPMETLCRQLEAEAANASLDKAKELLAQAEGEFERIQRYIGKMRDPNRVSA